MIYDHFYIHSVPLDTKITLVASGSVEQLPSIHSSSVLSLSTGVHSFNPNTQEEEAGESQVQGHLPSATEQVFIQPGLLKTLPQ